MEPPGTAPGSDPLITSAFMSIVPKDDSYIGEVMGGCKLRMNSAVFNISNLLGGFVEVCSDEPDGQNQFDSPKDQRLGQGGIVQRD